MLNIADTTLRDTQYFKEVREEAKQERDREIATKLLAEGTSIELIKKVTGLSESDLKALQPEKKS